MHGPRFEERWRFVDSTGALSAAAAGLGVALARDRIVAPWLAAGTLVRLPGPALPARWSYHVVYPAHRPLRAPARAFVEWLLADAA